MTTGSNLRSCALAIAAGAFLAGCAAPNASAPGGAASSPGAAPAPAARPAVVPALTVRLDCGTCQVRPNIPARIGEGYKEAADKAGVQIGGGEATLTVKEYVDRNDAARFWGGVFAGKDEIKAELRYQGRVVPLEDYYRNAWLGIDTLAGKIGGMAFDAMRK